MQELKLKRVSDNGEFSCGVFVYNETPCAVCLEPPKEENSRGIIRIPSGSYPSNKIGPTEKLPYEHIAVNNIPGHSDIRIHRGNDVYDTEGCLLAARQFAPHGVILSQMGLDDLLKILPSEFTLTITD